jgi:Lon protease-like protein
MRRELPPKPNLEHLKAQAKDLLQACKRGEREAFSRIRAAVPAFAHKSDAELARAPLALHDAQSAIAREYGFASWAELRTKVTAAGTAEPVFPMIAGRAVPPEVEAAIRAAMDLRGTRTGDPTPPTAPALPLRNAIVLPGALIAIDVTRPASLQAIEAAMRGEPAFLAVFAQRATETERPTSEDLHPTGSLCIVRVLHRVTDPPASSPRLVAWLLVEGIRQVKLVGLAQLDPYYIARIADTADDRSRAGDGDDGEPIAEIDRRLRELAHRFADTMPAGRDEVHALIDQMAEPGQLADLVMSNFRIPVADMVAYAEETVLARKLDRAVALLDAELAKALAPGSHE